MATVASPENKRYFTLAWQTSQSLSPLSEDKQGFSLSSSAIVAASNDDNAWYMASIGIWSGTRHSGE
jgi:hypothetical protein